MPRLPRRLQRLLTEDVLADLRRRRFEERKLERSARRRDAKSGLSEASQLHNARRRREQRMTARAEEQLAKRARFDPTTRGHRSD